MAWLSGPRHVAGLMLAFPLLVYLPTHLPLKRLWRGTQRAAGDPSGR